MSLDHRKAHAIIIEECTAEQVNLRDSLIVMRMKITKLEIYDDPYGERVAVKLCG